MSGTNKSMNDITKIIVETNEKNPKPIAVITADNFSVEDGFRVRITPKY